MSEATVREISDVLKDENIINDVDFHSNVDFVFGKMASSVERTLGPGGGLCMISHIDATVPVYPTKDGFTVVQEYKFNDQVKHFIAEIIKDISKRMNVKVGDSTTSGIIIAYALYKYLREYDIVKSHPNIGCKLPTISIRLILEEIRKYIMINTCKNTKYILKDLDRDLEDKLIRRVSTVSANNDPEIGNLVANLYTKRDSKYVYVSTELGTTDETFVEEEIGFDFGAGFINPIMANQTDRITCILEEPKFLLIDGPLTLSDLENVNKVIDYVIFQLGKPLVLVAKDFDQPVINSIVRRCTRNTEMRGNVPVLHEKEPLVCLSINGENEKSRDRLEDLRIILGCEIVETNKGKIMDFKSNVDFIEKFLGNAAQFKGTQLKTNIKRGGGDKEAVRERISHIEKRIGEVSLNEGILSFASVESLRRRISMLNSDMSIIRVGGANDKERRARRLIIDDAIMACHSSIEHGVTLGGNVTITHFIADNFDKMVKDITTNIVSNDIHVIVGNSEEHVSAIVTDIVGFVSEAFKAAYTVAIENMVGKDTPAAKKIISDVYITNEDPKVFDLVKGKLAGLEEYDVVNPLVPANTDYELMSSVFGSVGTLISSNQMLSIYPGQATVYRVTK